MDLVESITFSDARERPRDTAPLDVWVIRSLEVEDLPALKARGQSSQPLAPVQQLKAIRYSHHRLAQLLAQGIDQVTAGAATGYSPSYITLIKGDPTFQELLAAYGTKQEELFVDVVERMKQLGLDTLEEIQRRQVESPDSWSRRELMELADLMLVKGQTGARFAQSMAQVGVAVKVEFVNGQASPQPQQLEATATEPAP